MTGKTKGPQFDHLDTGQRSVIRRAVERGGDVEIERMARKYGVKVETVLRLLGRSEEKETPPHE